MHDRNYVPRWACAGDGATAIPVPFMGGKSLRGRWLKWQVGGYFFTGGPYPSLTHRPRKKAERLAVAHGERILADFRSGRPIWRYVAKSDSMPIGFERWQG